jgi:8-oxo-dGTP pyrophosphatase MutT (NUDIX family)
LWLSPGGHIDRGESLKQALNREISEELGVNGFFPTSAEPFQLTVTPIDNSVQPCKVHYDIWYLMLTDGESFNIDPYEFHKTRWLYIDEALEIITDPANSKVLSMVKHL